MNHPNRAHGVTGFILKQFHTIKGKTHTFFRIYSDDNDKKNFNDYEIWADDVEVTIQDKDNSLVFTEKDGRKVLDWSNQVLGIEDGKV